jgi:hypothetical protein
MTDVFAVLDRTNLPFPPRRLLEMVAQCPQRVEHATEKRRAPRFRLVTLVPAAPLDEEFQPCGEPFLAVSMDISTCGLGMVHSRMVTCKNLALEIAPPGGKPTRVIARVVRCRPFNGAFFIGCEFIKRMEPERE